MLVVVALLFTLTPSIFSQVKISPAKVTYSITNPEISEDKMTFEITYPRVSGNGPIAEIEKTISYWSNFETTLEESMSDTFLSELTYKVNYNGKGILDIELSLSGVGAYPSTTVKNIVVNLNTGERLRFADAFVYRAALRKRIEEAHENEQKRAAAEESEYDITDDLDGAKKYNSIYEIEEFSVSDRGVTFIFDYGFPHAILALQPEGRYFFTWEDLTPFVSEYGPLAEFLAKG